jgi:YcaO-like protein with predicted kinase domain
MRIFEEHHHQPKKFLPGTRRSRSPADTLADFGRFMPRIGITRLANVTGLDRIGIPVVQAVRPNSRALSVSQGKGVDLDCAKVSAMMEATELWHAERIESPLRHASWKDLRRGEAVVDLERLPRSAGAVVRPEAQRAWIRGWDLVQSEPVWVPHEICNMNTVGLAHGQMTFCCNSNGLASGNHLLEAIEHALCEVIERDTHALYWAGGLQAELDTRLDLATVTDPSVRTLLAACTDAEMDVCAYAMESDLGLPTFCVGLADQIDRGLWRRLGTQWGCGTHLSPAIALSRAVTEAAQARLTVIAGSRDDNPPQVYATSQDLDEMKASQATAFSAPVRRSFAASPSLAETESFEGDLEVMLRAVTGVGVDRVVVVDLTKREIGIPVVKVIVPGLEGPPFQADYTPGARALRVRKELS